MINEKVLSEAIREYFKNLIEQGLQEVEILKCNAELQKLIEEQLRVGEWIPCNEGMPKERDSIFAKYKGTEKWNDAMFEKISEEVQVTAEYRDGSRRTIASHTVDGKWKINSILKPKVIAWKPFSEPCNISSQDVAVKSGSPWKDHVMQRFTRSE